MTKASATAAAGAAGVTLAMRFLAGRYHGTAWGHHVNEARVDWPPAPWRILRALLACYHQRCADLEAEVVGSLLRKLSRPPHYQVPSYVEGHTRHYMPKDSTDADKRDMVLDAFVAISPDEPVLVQWVNVELTEAEQETLHALVGRVTYLGRAESWCEVRVEGRPALQTLPADRPSRSVSLLTPIDASLEELGADTATLRKRGVTRPPAGQFVSYPVPIAAPRRKERRKPRGERPILARFALAGKSLPALTEAAHVAECARGWLVARGKREPRFASSTLSGLDAAGQPLASDHGHAHYLPRDEDGDGRLETLWIWAPDGLGPSACAALEHLDELRVSRRGEEDGGDEAPQQTEPGRRWRPDLFLSLLGLGGRELFGARLALGPARVWRSATPFLLARHPKLRRGAWRDTASEQVRRELELRGWDPSQVGVEVSAELPGHPSDRENPLTHAPGSATAHPIHWLEFRRWLRRRHPASPFGFGVRLTFAEQQMGPIALGFGAHLGLGSFQIDEAAETVVGGARSDAIEP